MGNRGSPKNTQSIENRLSKIVEELIEIRKQEGKLRVEFKKLGIKRKELLEERKKLYNKEKNVFRRESTKNNITRRYGKGFTSPSKNTLNMKNNINNK